MHITFNDLINYSPSSGIKNPTSTLSVLSMYIVLLDTHIFLNGETMK